MKYALIDLHLHLDGSLNLNWAYQTALKRGNVPADFTLEQYYDYLHPDMTGLTREERLRKFDIPISIMLTKEDLHDSIFHLIEDIYKRGIIYAEIRFASQQHTAWGLSQMEVMQAVVDGRNDALKAFPGIYVQIINCMMHKGLAYNNEKENLETIDVAKAFLGKGVCAVDLAGYENSDPNFYNYKKCFDYAKELGVPFTCHAGEMGEGRHVVEAIEMGASRIGHGVNCVQNPEWVQKVAETQIPLEVCVCGNSAMTRNYAAHPIRTLINAGCKCTLNTDNMTFIQTSLDNEYSQVMALGVSDEQLRQLVLNSVDAAFLSEDKKEILRQAVLKRIA